MDLGGRPPVIFQERPERIANHRGDNFEILTRAAQIMSVRVEPPDAICSGSEGSTSDNTVKTCAGLAARIDEVVHEGGGFASASR